MNNPIELGDPNRFIFKLNDHSLQIEFESSDLIISPVTVEVFSNDALYTNLVPTVAETSISVIVPKAVLQAINEKNSKLYIRYGEDYVYSYKIRTTLDGSFTEPRTWVVSAPTVATVRVSTYNDYTAVQDAMGFANESKYWAQIAEDAAANADRAYNALGDWDRAANVPVLSSVAPAPVGGKFAQYTITNPGAMPFAISNVAMGANIGYGTLNAKENTASPGTYVWYYDASSSAALDKVNAIESRFLEGFNLFDYTNMTESGTINADGTLAAHATLIRTKPIPVIAGQPMKLFNRVTNGNIRFENASNGLISAIAIDKQILQPFVFTPPPGTAYIRHLAGSSAAGSASYADLQLQYGADVTNLQNFQYYEKISQVASKVLDNSTLENAGDLDTSVLNKKKLIDVLKLLHIEAIEGVETLSHNLADPKFFINDRYVNNAGQFLQGTGYRAVAIPVIAGQQYTITGRGWNTSLAFYSDNTPSQTLISTIAASGTTTTFTVPVGATYLYTSVDLPTSNWATTNGTFQFYTGSGLKTFAPFGRVTFTPTSIGGTPFSAVTEDGLEDYIEINNIPKITGVEYVNSYNLADPAAIVENAYLNNVSGMPVGATGYRYIVLQLNPGSTYKIQGRGWDIQLHFFDTNVTGRTKISTVTAGTEPYQFTMPLGANYLYATIDYQAVDWPITNNSLTVYEGTETKPFVPFGPVSMNVTEFNGLPVTVGGAGGSGSLTTKLIKLQDRELIQFWGNSYTEGYPALPGKDYVSMVSMLTDWGTANIGFSGQDVAQILNYVRTNVSRWGVLINGRKGGGFAMINDLTNSGGHGMIGAANGGYDVYLGHIDSLCEAALSLGLKPIVSTEWTSPSGIGNLSSVAIAEFAYNKGIPFFDIRLDAAELRGADNPKYYMSAHPGVRTNSLMWAQIVPKVKCLPRPKWGIKIYRKRDFVAVSSVADLAYKNTDIRASLFREIRGGASTIKDSHKQYFDDLTTLAGIGYQIETVGEYEMLMNASTINMPSYGLIEFIVNATAPNISQIQVFVGAIGLTTYVYNHKTQVWDSISNDAEGVITLTNLQNYLEFDKLCVLLYKAVPYTLSEPWLKFTGIEGKRNDAREFIKYMRGANRLATPHFNSDTTGWTVVGSVPTAAPSDGSSPVIAPPDGTSAAVAVTKVATISPGNYVIQKATFAAVWYRRKAQLIAYARFNPPTFNSANLYPDTSPITEDTFDQAWVKISLYSGATSSNNEYASNVTRLAGLWWQKIVVDFEVLAGATELYVSIQAGGTKSFELAYLTFVVEP